MISVAIIHCPRSPERVANVATLRAAIPDAVLVEDRGAAIATNRLRRVGCWPIARSAWRVATERHHLVLEDDAGLCADFLAQVEQLVERRPNACLSLFSGARDCSVATVLPRHVIPRWLAWVDSAPLGIRHLPHHDWLISQGMRELGVEHLCTEPSIVEHQPLASLLDHEHVAATRFEQYPGAITFRKR